MGVPWSPSPSSKLPRCVYSIYLLCPPPLHPIPPHPKKKIHTHLHTHKSIASLFLSASFPQFFTLYIYTTYLLLAPIDLSSEITCMRGSQVVCDCQHPALICPSVGGGWGLCISLPATSKPSVGNARRSRHCNIGTDAGLTSDWRCSHSVPVAMVM